MEHSIQALLQEIQASPTTMVTEVQKFLQSLKGTINLSMPARKSKLLQNTIFESKQAVDAIPTNNFIKGER